MNRLQHAVNHADKLRRRRIVRNRNAAKRIGFLIYFVQAGKYIKVGISRKDAIKSRMHTIKTCNPHKIKLLKVLHTTNPLRDERMFHELLKPFHIRGEWFLIDSPAILELLGA